MEGGRFGGGGNTDWNDPLVRFIPNVIKQCVTGDRCLARGGTNIIPLDIGELGSLTLYLWVRAEVVQARSDRNQEIHRREERLLLSSMYEVRPYTIAV